MGETEFQIEMSPIFEGFARAVWGKDGLICTMEIEDAVRRHGMRGGMDVVNRRASMIAMGDELLAALESTQRYLKELEAAGFGCCAENPVYLRNAAVIESAKGI